MQYIKKQISKQCLCIWQFYSWDLYLLRLENKIFKPRKNLNVTFYAWNPCVHIPAILFLSLKQTLHKYVNTNASSYASFDSSCMQCMYTWHQCKLSSSTVIFFYFKQVSLFYWQIFIGNSFSLWCAEIYYHFEYVLLKCVGQAFTSAFVTSAFVYSSKGCFWPDSLVCLSGSFSKSGLLSFIFLHLSVCGAGVDSEAGALTLSSEDFRQALSGLQPSVSEQQLNRYKLIQHKFTTK